MKSQSWYGVMDEDIYDNESKKEIGSGRLSTSLHAPYHDLIQIFINQIHTNDLLIPSMDLVF